MKKTSVVAVLAATVLAAFLAPQPGCSERSRPAARVLLVGVDGLEWNVLRPLLAQGRCPNLRSLMDRGSFGRLATMTPTLSPILWTTIATGRMPAEHGIEGFTDADLKQYTSAERRGRAVWNIADRAGLACDVVGWWITWPAEEIRGVMVSGSSSSALVDSNWKPAILPGVPKQVHPESLTGEVLAIAERAGSLTETRRLAREKVFGEALDAELGPVEERLVKETLWSIQSDATFSRIATWLLAERPADLTMVYLGGPDVVGHRFWRYYEPASFRWPVDPEAERALAGTIPGYYEWVDEMIGELVSAAGEDAAVIVCSDHGMHADSTEEPNEKGISGHHQDGPPGVIVAAGKCIRRGDGLAELLAGSDPPLRGHVLDVTPTLLALLGVPRSVEMSGRAITAILEGAARANADLPPVATHDEGFRPPTRIEPPAEMNRNFLERFKQLGYIGEEDEARKPR